MKNHLPSSVFTKWLYQEGNWSWQCIRLFLQWWYASSWQESQKLVRTLPAKKLCELWNWNFAGISPTRQERSVLWLKEQSFDLSESFLRAWLESRDHSEWAWCTPLDSEYPSALLELEDPPPVLWCSWPVSELQSFLHKTPLAVVGSRRISSYGRLATQDFVRVFTQDFQIPIVSGGAYGVDSLAHDTCLQYGGRTIAFLPHGCLQVPKRLQGWLKNPQFLAVTEFPPDYPVERWRFAQRNRLIAGVSCAVLVIEAGQRSGTLLTAGSAFLQGKEVFVVTQPRQNHNVEGIFSLLENGAHLVATPQHILHRLFSEENNTSKVDSQDFLLQQAQSPLERVVIEHLLQNNGQIFALQCRKAVQKHVENPSDWPQALLSLELRGVLKQELGVLHLTSRV